MKIAHSVLKFRLLPLSWRKFSGLYLGHEPNRIKQETSEIHFRNKEEKEK